MATHSLKDPKKKGGEGVMLSLINHSVFFGRSNINCIAWKLSLSQGKCVAPQLLLCLSSCAVLEKGGTNFFVKPKTNEKNTIDKQGGQKWIH